MAVILADTIAVSLADQLWLSDWLAYQSPTIV